MQPLERIRAIIVDDEPLACEKLARFLGDEPDVEVVAQCHDGIHAIEAIGRLAPDLVLLDVQMPRCDGFEVIEAVGVDRMPMVIFVTAFDQFALRAFEVHAIDYLLKPYDRERLQTTLDHARQVLATRRGAGDERIRGLLGTVRGGAAYPSRFLVRSGDEYVFVNTDDIAWLEAAANYVTLHVGGQAYLVRQTVSAMETRLDPERFVRIRASCVVNLDHVAAVRPWSGVEYQVVLRGGATLLTSRRYRDRLRSFLLR